jgi:hypothetical protein
MSILAEFMGFSTLNWVFVIGLIVVIIVLLQIRKRQM